MFSPGLVTDLYSDKAQNCDTAALCWHIHRKCGCYAVFHKAQREDFSPNITAKYAQNGHKGMWHI